MTKAEWQAHYEELQARKMKTETVTVTASMTITGKRKKRGTQFYLADLHRGIPRYYKGAGWVFDGWFGGKGAMVRPLDKTLIPQVGDVISHTFEAKVLTDDALKAAVEDSPVSESSGMSFSWADGNIRQVKGDPTRARYYIDGTDFERFVSQPKEALPFPEEE